MTCREVLHNYIKKHEGWHKKVHLYAEAEDWSPETVGRELRDMVTDGLLEVGSYKGTHRKVNLAKYRLIGQKEVTRYYVPDLGKEIVIIS